MARESLSVPRVFLRIGYVVLRIFWTHSPRRTPSMEGSLSDLLRHVPQALAGRIATTVFCVLAITMAAGCGGGGGSSSTPATAQAVIGSPSPAATTLAMDLTKGYTDTGIAVVPGEQLTFAASGTLNWGGTCTTCSTPPSGDAWSTCSYREPPNYPLPGMPCWSLIGKVGATGAPFEIGSSLNYTVPAGVSGELYVGVNDNILADNSGSWSVAINETAP